MRIGQLLFRKHSGHTPLAKFGSAALLGLSLLSATPALAVRQQPIPAPGPGADGFIPEAWLRELSYLKQIVGNWQQWITHPVTLEVRGLQPWERCYNQNSRVLQRAVSYCVFSPRPLPANISRIPVVYFMHGVSGDASTPIGPGSYGPALHALASRPDFPDFIFVSFTTEAMSFHSDYGGQPNGPRAYETWFIREFVPYMERQHGVCDRRDCRILTGASMGGLGAIKTALRYPEMFAAAIANSPALPALSLYDNDRIWSEFFNHWGIGALHGLRLIHHAREIFPTAEAAAAHDPIKLVENFDPSAHPWPLMYFDMGTKDTFGFQLGYDNLVLALRKRGFPFASRKIPGGAHLIFPVTRWNMFLYVKKALDILRPRIAAASLAQR